MRVFGRICWGWTVWSGTVNGGKMVMYLYRCGGPEFSCERGRMVHVNLLPVGDLQSMYKLFRLMPVRRSLWPPYQNRKGGTQSNFGISGTIRRLLTESDEQSSRYRFWNPCVDPIEVATSVACLTAVGNTISLFRVGSVRRSLAAFLRGED